MQTYRLKPGKLGRKLQGIYRGMERAFVDTFLEPDGSLRTGGMAEKATGAYRRVERAVVGRYQRIEDAFVARFLEPGDETHNGKED